MPHIENDLYNQVEKMVSPIIESNARKFYNSLSLTIDEARQEARIALMFALRKYDYNDSRGGIYNFAATSVRRHFLKLLAANYAQKRRPHVKIKDGDKVKTRFLNNTPMILDQYQYSDFPNPEEVKMKKDSDTVARMLEEALIEALDEREKEVFRCKLNPSRDLRMIMAEECEQTPTIPTIGKHLSLSKNAVDWSIKKIKDTAVTIIRTKFSTLAESEVVREYMEKNL